MASVDDYIEQAQYDGTTVKIRTKRDTETDIHTPVVRVPGASWEVREFTHPGVLGTVDLSDPIVNVWSSIVDPFELEHVFEFAAPEDLTHEVVVVVNGWPYPADPGSAWVDGNGSSVSWAALPPQMAEGLVTVRLVPFEMTVESVLYTGLVGFTEATFRPDHIIGLQDLLDAKVGSDGSVTEVVALTQTAYDALTPDPTTLYFITGA